MLCQRLNSVMRLLLHTRSQTSFMRSEHARDDSRATLVVLDNVCDAKVGNHGSHPFIKENIGWFQVNVHNITGTIHSEQFNWLDGLLDCAHSAGHVAGDCENKFSAIKKAVIRNLA